MSRLFHQPYISAKVFSRCLVRNLENLERATTKTLRSALVLLSALSRLYFISVECGVQSFHFSRSSRTSNRWCETAPHFCFVHYSTAGRVTFGFMKKYIWISLIAAMSIACGKDSPSQNNSDPADEFVGSYTYTETYTEKWGLDNTEGTGNGSFTIIKTGSNGVKVEGAFNATGIVNAGMLNFVDYKSKDDIFDTSYYFGAAMFTGKDLNLTYRRSGTALKNGYPFSYEKVGKVTARKK